MDRVFGRTSSISIEDLREGGMLLVDKPLEWTSFDVVNKLRYTIRHKLGQKRYKIGHAGTLDPLASGLLLLCFSKYTKKIESLMTRDKSYSGTIRLWATTPCYDSELPVDQYFPCTAFTESQLLSVAQQLTGDIKQMPPIYSAIKKNGVPLYKLARKGKKAVIEPRDITIHSFDILSQDLPEISFQASCSKGTYIRSLAHDFGGLLNNGGYLSSLRRLSVGEYKVDDAWQLNDLVDHIQNIDI
jgi:tRNA pseudouridine55 synthase